MAQWLKVVPTQLEENPFSLIGDRWYLLSAGVPENFNTMTASWGAVGVIWGAPALHCFVRTNRYTLEYLDSNELFTASFFPEKYHDALAFCGANSGRDVDKMAVTGLTPVAIDGSVTYEEANLVFVCRKKYTALLQDDGFIGDETKQQFYGRDPMHREFIGEIIACYRQEN